MNLPVGDIISQGLNLREIDVKKLIEGLYEKAFSGYLVATLYGFDGVEESVMIFKEGGFIAAIYEYELYGITVFGDSAVPHIFNSFAVEHIVADIVSLSNQQVDLITAFNDKAKLAKIVQKQDIAKMVPKGFSAELARSMLNELVKQEDDKSNVFKKLGLSGLGD